MPVTTLNQRQWQGEFLIAYFTVLENHQECCEELWLPMQNSTTNSKCRKTPKAHLQQLQHYRKPVASDAKLNHKFHKVVADLKSRLLQLPWHCRRASLQQCPGVTERVCFLLSARADASSRTQRGFREAGGLCLAPINAHLDRCTQQRQQVLRFQTGQILVTQCSWMPGVDSSLRQPSNLGYRNQ